MPRPKQPLCCLRVFLGVDSILIPTYDIFSLGFVEAYMECELDN